MNDAPDYSLDALRKTSIGTINEVLGVEVIEAERGRIVGTMPVTEKNVQPYGILHGGASVVLAETLGSIGSALIAGETGKRAVGLEVNANHVRPAPKGTTVTGEAVLAHEGRRIHVWQITLRNEAGKPTCLCRLTVSLID
ncbi:hotdog fold thioesterase [uncultured Abyssibacter sp.]|uniref:PaaI family thioesterase n=1 Tax=uncultured Abyssibacter sp. TaxID=2320202 RepID=UPI0032B1B312